ncbi:ABC transporter [Popillia japonica]
MRVQRGSIYGLLGASGCGKTTLLSCIVGRKKLDSGDVWVLGGVPGTENSGVPGCRVGYMPQDINLVGEFTVKGAISYFGRILDMTDELIEERFKSLKKLLDLPPDDRMIKNCSGGQQRRVSFAAAMVHKPELLILDEPTVGLDPVLRDSIWNYLVEISQKENTAIVITTHYIEEAKQANYVGLMREGRLLAEDSPERLLNLFRCDTLEDVFLILCMRQEEGQLSDLEYNIDEHQNGGLQSAESASSIALSEMGHGSLDILTKKSPPIKRNKQIGTFSLNKNHLKALMAKNYLQYFRNTAGLVFNLIFPIIEMLAFLSAIGGDVKNIGLGIVNDEYPLSACNHYNRMNTAIPYSIAECNFTELSCRFLEDVRDPMIHEVYYEDFESAVNDASHGKIIGVLHISQNFSESYKDRLVKGGDADDGTLDSSQIKVWLDMSNRQIGATLKFKLLSKFVDFQRGLTKDCRLPKKLAEIPIHFNYEYGSDQETYTVYMTPGVLLTIMFFMGTTPR